MDKRTFERAFNAVFHDDKAFSEFCSMDLTAEVKMLKFKSQNVYQTSDKLKKYLRFIDKVLLRHLQQHEEIVHSYIRGKSVLTAVQAHANNKYFFMTDIKSFFGCITASDIEKILQRDQDLIPVSDFSDFIPTIINLTTLDNSIPIGFVTSPRLSNAFLLEFDIELNKLCLDEGLVCTRYSDDIIISSSSVIDASEMEIRIQKLLWEFSSRRLILNKKKTRTTHKGNKVKILGLVITLDGSVSINSEYKKILEPLLYFYINDKNKYNDLLGKKFKGMEHSLFGLLHYTKSIDPQYIAKLQAKYGIYALSTLMEDKWSG